MEYEVRFYSARTVYANARDEYSPPVCVERMESNGKQQNAD